MVLRVVYECMGGYGLREFIFLWLMRFGGMEPDSVCSVERSCFCVWEMVVMRCGNVCCGGELRMCLGSLGWMCRVFMM